MFHFDPQSGKLIRTNRGDFISGGLAGGQTATGDTASGGNLTLMSTAHATKGKILLGGSAYDEVNNRLGIGTASPTKTLDVVGNGTATGYLRVGSATAPANTTAGDLTAVRLSLGNGAFSSGNGTLLVGNGTMTDTASGAVVLTHFTNTITPVSNSSSEFRAIYFQNITNPADGVTLSSLAGGVFENRIRSTGLITGLKGVRGWGMAVDSSSPATVQATTISAFEGIVFSRPSGTTVPTIGTGVGFDLQSNNWAGTVGAIVTSLIGMRVQNPGVNTITNLIGLSVEDLTRGTNNRGISLAISSGANKYNIYADGTADNYLNGITTFTKQIISSLAIGTKPFAVTSTTKCDNLNADLWDGLHSTDVPNIKQNISLTAQVLAIGATPITGTATTGLYRVSYSLLDTTADITAGTIMVNFAGTDEAGAFTMSSVALPLTALGRTQGSFFLRILGTGSISYSTTLVGIIGASQYALFVDCEKLL